MIPLETSCKNKASEDLAINGRKKKTLMKSGSFVIEDIIKNKLKYITLKTMTIKGISLFFFIVNIKRRDIREGFWVIVLCRRIQAIFVCVFVIKSASHKFWG